MNPKRILLSLTSILLLAIIGVYGYEVHYFSQHFLPNTTTNNVEVSNRSLKEAESTLIKQADKDTFKILDQGKEWRTVPRKELGIEIDYPKGLQQILDKQNNYLWFTAYFKEHKHVIEEAKLNEKEWDKYSATLKTDMTKLNEGRKVSSNASIKKGEAGFEIVPEVQGDNIDVNLAVAEIKKSLAAGAQNIELESYKFEPTVLADNPELKTNLDNVNKIVQQKVEYLIGGETVAVPQDVIATWIDYDAKNNKVALNKESLRQYLTDLGAKYNTSQNPTNFQSTKRGQVSVPAGSYSWSIATDDETEALYKDLLAGNGVSRTPAFVGSASATSPLVGDTYIEIDLQNQHMWYYKGGAVQLETPIVSGKPTTQTPPGVFYVWAKKRNETLRGRNDDGSKYAEPVSYWMPIDWTGVGIHDSPWQPSYGGQLWKSVGSHGCINTPPNVASKLFESIDEGVPVLVF